MELNTTEDIIWLICSITMIVAAIFLGRSLKEGLLDIAKLLIFPFVIIAKILDATWWAEKFPKRKEEGR